MLTTNGTGHFVARPRRLELSVSEKNLPQVLATLIDTSTETHPVFVLGHVVTDANPWRSFVEQLRHQWNCLHQEAPTEIPPLWDPDPDPVGPHTSAQDLRNELAQATHRCRPPLSRLAFALVHTSSAHDAEIRGLVRVLSSRRSFVKARFVLVVVSKETPPCNR